MSTTKQVRAVNRWAVPAFCVLAGGALFAAAAASGRLGLGVAMAAILIGYAAVLVFFRNREPVAMLAEESTDERRRLIQLRSGYFALNLVTGYILLRFVLDVWQGRDGQPWIQLAAIIGLATVVALIYNSRRG